MEYIIWNISLYILIIILLSRYFLFEMCLLYIYLLYIYFRKLCKIFTRLNAEISVCICVYNIANTYFPTLYLSH